jgi:hypothetical protein
MLRDILHLLERRASVRTTGCSLVLARPANERAALKLELSPQAAGLNPVCTDSELCMRPSSVRGAIVRYNRRYAMQIELQPFVAATLAVALLAACGERAEEDG